MHTIFNTIWKINRRHLIFLANTSCSLVACIQVNEVWVGVCVSVCVCVCVRVGTTYSDIRNTNIRTYTHGPHKYTFSQSPNKAEEW